MVVRRCPLQSRGSARPSPSVSHSVHGRPGHRLGCVAQIRTSFGLVVSDLLSIFDQPPRASSDLPGSGWIFSQLLRHQSVALFTDNTTVLAYLRKEGGTRSSTLNSVAQAILRFCEHHSIRLLPQFIPRKMNVLADALSRSPHILGSKWTLCQEVCRELFCLWPVTVDLFATSLNNRFPVYYSPVVDPQAAGVDVMLQPWDHLQAYAFPPFGLVRRLLAKVR